jgi:hypothetical protein
MTPSDRRLLSLLFLSAGVLSDFGDISSAALACVLIAVGLGIQSLSPKPWGPRLPGVARIGLLLALAATILLYSNKVAHPVYAQTFAILAAAILLYALVKAAVAKVVAFALAGASLAIGIAANFTWGFADIDVFHFQQSAAQALLHGQNPYAPIVRSPEMVPPGVRAYLHLHFPYGPTLPILEAAIRPFGDIRVLHILAALVISAAVLLIARRAGTLDRTACVVMAFPLTTAMILFSWVDVITMAGLVVWLVTFRSHPRIAIVALVIALGAKPTTLIALVPIFWWSIRARRQVMVATVITALVVLPFAVITGFSQFYYNVLGVQLSVLPRLDSLTINSFLNAYGLPILPFAVSATVIAAAAVLVLHRRPESYGELLTGTAILAIVSFLVAKWAYLNYYYIPAVLLMLAIAANDLEVDTPEMIRPPALFLRTVEWRRALAGRFLPRRRVPAALVSGGAAGQEPA